MSRAVNCLVMEAMPNFVWGVFGALEAPVRFADAFGVDDFAAVRDENRAVKVAQLLVVRNELVDALRFVERRFLASQLGGREQKKQGQKGRELAGHAGEDTSPTGENQRTSEAHVQSRSGLFPAGPSQLTHLSEPIIESISAALCTKRACGPDFAALHPPSLTTRLVSPSIKTYIEMLSESKHHAKALSSRLQKWARSRLSNSRMSCARVTVPVCDVPVAVIFD